MSTNPSLPFLPGYQIATTRPTNFAKSQFFEVQNGTRVDHSQSIYQSQNQLLNKPMQLDTGVPQTHYQITHADPAETQSTANSSSMSRLPAWVAYDRQVLRFYGHFNEPVHCASINSSLSQSSETMRVRHCVLYLYLEDESMHIAEPKIENSGIPQGVFVKRHRIPKGNNAYYGVSDLFVGATLPVYGRVFHLTDADKFTRQFYASKGTPLASIESSEPSSTSPSRSTHKLMHPAKLYMEASLGKPMLPSSQATQQFLTRDGQVLRFYASWDDDKMYGERKPYILHYYLADDTIEINEISTPNNGRDPFPLLLKRGKLPKQWQQSLPNVARLGQMGMGNDGQPEADSFYTLLDLRIGNTINVYGRLLLLCSLDKFTQEFYMKNFGLSESDFQPVVVDDPEVEIRAAEPPPHNGYGTEEDSLGSCLFLMPKVPKTDFHKLQEYDGVHLRFGAKFANVRNPVDENRRFILTLYCATDQLSIFEKLERNSGFLAGKFLEKSKLKNPATGSYFHWGDFSIGNKVVVNDYVFEITEADEFTLRWLRDRREGLKGRTEEHKTQF